MEGVDWWRAQSGGQDEKLSGMEGGEWWRA